MVGTFYSECLGLYLDFAPDYIVYVHVHVLFEGDRCFVTSGPRLCNSLPSKIRQYDSLREFKRLLKTHLLGDYGTL